MEVIEGLRFLASLPLAVTGRTEGGEKTQPFNRFHSHPGTDREKVVAQILKSFHNHICACGTSPANLDCRVGRAGASVLAEPPQGAREHLVKVGDELHALEEEAILSNCCSKYRVPLNCQDYRARGSIT